MNNMLPVGNSNTVTKDIKIGSKEFIIRPWLTREEKNFLIEKSLLEKKNKKPNVNDIYKLLIKTLVQPCVIDGEYKNLSFDELRYLIVQIKKISSGEVVENIIVKCPSCNTPLDVNVNLDGVEYKSFDSTVKKINNDLKIKFKQIPFNIIKEEEDELFYIYESIDEIILKDKIYKGFSKENWDQFMDEMSINDTKKIGKVLSECFSDFKIPAEVSCIKEDCEHSHTKNNPIKLDLSDKENFYMP